MANTGAGLKPAVHASVPCRAVHPPTLHIRPPAPAHNHPVDAYASSRTSLHVACRPRYRYSGDASESGVIPYVQKSMKNL